MSVTATQQIYEMSPHQEATISSPSSSTYHEIDDELQPEKEKEKLSDLKQYIRSVTPCALGGVVCGLNDGSIGTILPRIKEYYGITDGIVSLLFMCSALGFVTSASLNGTLVHKVGQRPLLYFAATLIVVAFAFLSAGFPFGAMGFFIGCSGFGCALLNAGANVYMASLPYATLMLNLFHATYGVGAMVAPLVGTFLLERNISWKGVYVFNTVIAFITLVTYVYGFWKVNFEIPEDNNNNSNEANTENKLTHAQLTRAAIFHRMTLTGCVFVLFYVGVEATLGGWGYTFLTEKRSGDEISMGKVMSGYWAGLAAGRLTLGYFTGRLGEKLMVTVFTLFIITALFLMIFLSNIALNSTVLIAIGFFLGPLFPTTVSLASKVLPRSYHATSIGLIAAKNDIHNHLNSLGSSGAAIFPFLTGQITSKFGLLAVPVACLIMSSVMMCLWMFLPSDRPFFGALRLKMS
ncbi:MFS general substrate transporter [Backusella circina FSU 941]|nr:MFS general substrate transporter [Backusella circina FSU 941]